MNKVCPSRERKRRYYVACRDGEYEEVASSHDDSGRKWLWLKPTGHYCSSSEFVTAQAIECSEVPEHWVNVSRDIKLDLDNGRVFCQGKPVAVLCCNGEFRLRVIKDASNNFKFDCLVIERRT